MMDQDKHPRLFTLLGVILVVAALYFAKAVLVLFAIAFLVAFLLAPVVNRIQKTGLPRVPSVVIVMMLALSIAACVGWLVVGQANDLVNKLPEYQGNLQEKFSTLRQKLDPIKRATKTVAEITRPESGPTESESVQEVKMAENPSSGLDALLAPVSGIIDVLAAIGLVILLAAVMMIQKEDMRDRLIRLAGAGQLYVTTRAFDEASEKVSRYLLLTTFLNATHGVCIAVGLTLLEVPNAMLWGLLGCLLRFIPYIGPWIAAAFPIALSLAVFPGWTVPLMTVGLVLFLELVSNNILEPWVYGAGTGISSGALIIAAVFWTWIWGVPGLFLATPLTVCLAVMGKYVPPLRFLHVVFTDEPVLSGKAKLYQRLLASDLDEAWEIVRKELESKSRVEVSDSLLIPALALAERERHDGTLDARAFESVARSMQGLVDEVDDYERKEKPGKEAPEAEVPETRTAPPDGVAAVPMLCIAAEDAADGVVASMAEGPLRRIGFDPFLVQSSALTGELPRLAEERNAQVALISNLPPSGFAQVRYICKRLAGKLDELHVIIGIWGSKLDVEKARERLPKNGTFYFVSSIAEAVRQAHEIGMSLTLKENGGGRERPDSSAEAGPSSKAPSTERISSGKVRPPRAAL